MPRIFSMSGAWLLPAAVCLGLPAGGLAQSLDESEPESDGAQVDSGFNLEPVIVTATRSRSKAGETPQKVQVISRKQIDQQLAISDDQGQALSTLIPSYSPSRQKLSNSGETFRGREPLFLLDGVPQSNPLRDSSRDSYTVDLSAVDHIEVIYGASAEQGLGATGGIINFVTKRAESGTINQQVSAALTSDDDFESNGFGHKFNYQISGATEKWDYLANVTQQDRGVFYDGDDQRVGIGNQGEIQNSSSYNALLKLGYWFDDHQNIEFSANRFDLENNNDMVPVAGDRDQGIPTTARDGNPDGGAPYNKVTTLRLSYGNDSLLGNELNAQVYSERFRGQFVGGTLFPFAANDGDTGFDQTRNESDKVGAKITLNRRGILSGYLDVTTGVDLLQDETQQTLVQTGRVYVPETRFRNYAPFFQASVHVTDALTLHGGIRYEVAKLKIDDYASIDRSNILNDDVTVAGGEPDFDETLFNGGLVYQVNDWLQFYGNYSEGFGIPDVGRVLRGISQPNQNVDDLLQLAPIVTDNKEVGTRINWDRYSLELSYFESDSDLGERFEADDRGIYRTQREKTEIKGVELTASARVSDAHSLDMSYAHNEGRSDTDGDGRVDNKLTGINIAPDTLRLGWSASWTDNVSTRLQGGHYFDRDVEDPELNFDGYTLVDASLAYSLPVGTASLGVENLLDKNYFTYYSQSARISDDFFFKGRGRVFKLTYQVDF